MKYTDDILLNKVRLLPSYKGTIPEYLLIAVRSNKDTPNVFDDKVYLYINGKFKVVTTCTTNPGGPTLLGGWKKYNKLGAAVIKSDEIYYDGFKYGLHNGKMEALRQVKPFKYYRDGNNDSKTDEKGNIYVDIYNTNFHFNSYNLWTKVVNSLINNWSAGCVVCNISEDYRKIINLCKNAPSVSFALLKEF